jgi:hypothetical protein
LNYSEFAPECADDPLEIADDPEIDSASPDPITAHPSASSPDEEWDLVQWLEGVGSLDP